MTGDLAWPSRLAAPGSGRSPSSVTICNRTSSWGKGCVLGRAAAAPTQCPVPGPSRGGKMRGPEQTWGQDERAPHRTKREAESPLNKAGECADRPGTPGGLPFTGPLGTGTDLEWEGTPPGHCERGAGGWPRDPPSQLVWVRGARVREQLLGTRRCKALLTGGFPRGPW